MPKNQRIRLRAGADSKIKADARNLVRIDGEDLPYLDLGQRDAPTLIFINGALLTMEFWKYQAPAQHFRTIVCDYRESGLRANNAEGLTTDLADIVELLDLAPVTIVASSMGGLFAAVCRRTPGAAQRHGDLLDLGLTLAVGPSHHPVQEQHPRRDTN